MNTYINLVKESILETLWPTRCAICDLPGTLLCNSCKKQLPYLDLYHACPRCGAAFGRVICTECNNEVLKRKNLDSFPLDACASALRATDEALRLIRMYKDRGEYRMASLIAELLVSLIHPSWPKNCVLVAIPPTPQALRKRGFDHMAPIVKNLSITSGIPAIACIKASKRKDQRLLDAQRRLANLEGGFYVYRRPVPHEVILVDDVFTTGATLFTAAKTLRDAGTTWVGGLTLLRV